MKNTYIKANSGFNLNAPIDPKEIGKELSKLGHFTPEKILNRAASPTSPLHKYFEWDDSKAAHAYRLEQARSLVISVHIEEGIRAFESVVIDNKRVYVPHTDVIQSDNLISQVLDNALKDLLYWRAKNEKYHNHFGSVFRSIDEAETTIRRKYGKTSKGGRKNVHRDKIGDSTNQKGNRKNNDNRRLSAAR